MNQKNIWKRKLYSILLVFFIFHFLSIFSMILLFRFLYFFFNVINILFFIQIAYFIFCKFYTKFNKIMVKKSFLWLFFVRGMIFFSILCLFSSFFITLSNTEKITLLYYISIFQFSFFIYIFYASLFPFLFLFLL
jgi:hypothetical protein